MAAPKIGKAVQFMIEELRSQYGDVVIEKEHAEALWEGTKATTIAKATDMQLVHYLLLSAHAELDRAIKTIEALQTKQGPNRAARRAAKSK